MPRCHPRTLVYYQTGRSPLAQQQGRLLGLCPALGPTREAGLRQRVARPRRSPLASAPGGSRGLQRHPRERSPAGMTPVGQLVTRDWCLPSLLWRADAPKWHPCCPWLPCWGWAGSQGLHLCSGRAVQQQVFGCAAELLSQISCRAAGASTPESPQPDWARGTSSAAAAAADAASSDIPEEARIELAEYEALKESLRVSTTKRQTAPTREGSESCRLTSLHSMLKSSAKTICPSPAT